MVQAGTERGGIPLESLLRRQRATGEAVPLGATLELLAEVTQSLSRFHSSPGLDGRPRREAHGDVGPGTVLVSPSGTVSLKTPGRRTELQDPSVDLTGVGRLLHELVTLTPAVLPGGAQGRMLAVDQIDAAERRVRRTSLELAIVFRRCVHESAEDRYLDAASLLRDLQRMRGKLPETEPLKRWLAELAGRAPTPASSARAPSPARAPAPPAGSATSSAFTLQLDGAAPPNPTAAPPPSPGPAVPDLFAGSSTAPALAPASPPRERRERRERPAPVAPPSTRKRQIWQKRAARRAALGRLVGLVIVGLAALFAATFLPGSIGEQARALWEPLVASARGLIGR